MGIGRNQLCPCGSGKKYKKCCLSENKDEQLNKLYFITFVLNARETIKRCLKILPPDENIGYKICIGLLVRFHKLFDSVSRNIEIADGLSVSILIRPLYETALTLEYLVTKWDKLLFEEFVLTNAIRERDMINFLESSSANKRKDIKLDKDEIKRLKQSINEDQLNIDELPKIRSSSWHRTLSYRQMSRELGEEPREIFSLIYSSGSNAAHPSWSEIKKAHIQKDEKSGNYIPNYYVTCNQFTNYSLLICITFRICEVYARRFGDKNIIEYCQTLHKNFHDKFNQKMIASPEINSDNLGIGSASHLLDEVFPLGEK